MSTLQEEIEIFNRPFDDNWGSQEHYLKKIEIYLEKTKEEEQIQQEIFYNFIKLIRSDLLEFFSRKERIKAICVNARYSIKRKHYDVFFEMIKLMKEELSKVR